MSSADSAVFPFSFPTSWRKPFSPWYVILAMVHCVPSTSSGWVSPIWFMCLCGECRYSTNTKCPLTCRNTVALTISRSFCDTKSVFRLSRIDRHAIVFRKKTEVTGNCPVIHEASGRSQRNNEESLLGTKQIGTFSREWLHSHILTLADGVNLNGGNE